MLIHSRAAFPLRSESLDDALKQISEYARRHLVANEHSELSIGLGESGAHLNQVLARRLPGDTQEFYLGMLRVGAPLTAAQYLDAISKAKPKRSHSMVSLLASKLSEPISLFDALADIVPPSGRGLMVLLILKGWRFQGETVNADVDLMLSRFRHGARTLSASLAIRFHALSLKDPVVKATIAAASERAGVPLGKPMAAFAAAANVPFGAPSTTVADARLESPSAESQLAVLQTFEEVLARAADQVAARPEDLATIPLLFSRSGGFDKRMNDVLARKKESVNLPSRVKRFMREQFSAYAFDAADAEQLWFRRPVAPTLDLLLLLNHVHQWGLGKTFTIEFGVDFPNTRFGGMHTGMGGTRRNIFWLFHEGWEKQIWAYTTSAELDTALDSCASVLRRVLPALEQHSQDLLLPVPTALPKGIEQRGQLSAREAYQSVLPLARRWAEDVELESVASVNHLPAGAGLAAVESSVGDDGRLRTSGTWGIKFLSRRLDRYFYYTVPHTGRIWWNYYPVQQGVLPKYSSVLDADDAWIDSTEVVPRAFAELRRRLGDPNLTHVWIALNDPKRYTGRFVWQARCISYPGMGRQRVDLSVEFDRKTGEIVA